MDLSLIQTHIDNFVDTWEGWGKVFGAFGGENGFFHNLTRAFDFLSSKPEGSDFFPQTSSVINVFNDTETAKSDLEAAEAAK